ncbi:MAG: hypothetical protein A2015_06965 [Spirochaetes bacterium GWF1_31_7]|nr:MAG: hypothetical protein A2Y30_09495 [Spirochaetes bacterium GWE1_32_154]OHD46570.1 MAG: hypothetical protein A2015_06965 [Spirochaetes bacterium GWF1_31_7]
MKNITIIFFTIFFLPQLIFCIDYNFTLNIDNEVEVGVPFRMDIEVMNNAKVDIQLLKQDDSISIKQAGVSKSLSLINGVQSLSVTNSYIITINSPGNYTIGPFRLSDKNETIEISSKSIKVIESSLSKTSVNISNSPDYLIQALVSKDSIYVNEYVDVDIVFYTTIEVRFNSYTSIQFPPNTWIENNKIGDDYRGKKNINNKIYDEYLIERKRVYINQPGVFKLESAHLDFYVFTRSSMFSFYSTPVSLETEPIVLTVKKLPDTQYVNKDIRVGKFKLDYTINKNEIIENSPLTLQLILQGVGDFHNIEDIPFRSNKEIEIFSSKSDLVKDNNQIVRKNWDILILPKEPGVHTIIFDDFVYFDPELKDFISINPDPITLHVKDDPSVSNVKKNSVIQDKIIIENPEKKFYISTILGKKNRVNYLQYNFYIIILIYISIIIIFLIHFFSKKLICITSLCIKKSPEIILKHELLIIKKNIHKYDSSKSLDAINLILINFIRAKSGLDVSNIKSNEIEVILKDKVSETMSLFIKKILTDLDYIRFSGIKISEDVIIKTCTDILSHLE